MIRKAVPEDLPAIVKIYDEIHAREEAGEVTTGWIRGVYPVQKTAEDSLARGDMFVQVSEEEGKKNEEVTASGIINQSQVDVYADGDWTCPAKDEDVMVLHTLIVSKNAKRQGVGSEFLRFYEDYARAHGCNCLRLDTNARNRVARAFYKKHGYTEVGIVPTVFNGIPGVDLVLLEKVL